uniref:CSS-motif domain-containing protein n=1 Tax=Pseudomonas fluorescens TaxID=294 RepID=UPI001785344B|nr:CSS-motif domain-containing protein [Pseudomonas fluorescens]
MLIAIGLAPVLCGMLVMLIQVDRKLDELSRFAAIEAVHRVDQVIDMLHESSSRNVHLAGRSCLEVAQQLRSHVAAIPNLRALALTSGNKRYCDSVDGEQSQLIESKRFSKHRLWLEHGYSKVSDAPILNYWLREQPNGVIAQADARTLVGELEGFENGILLRLEFGQDYLWPQHSEADALLPDQREHRARAISDQFGYSVQAGYPLGHSRNEMKQWIIMTLPSLILVGILTGGIGYWGMFRQGPRRRTAPRVHTRD